MSTFAFQDFEDVATQALTQYGLQGASLGFLQQSDSITFQVQAASGAQYLLRIHVPLAEAMGEHGSSPVMLRSELQWLDALRRSSGLVLQSPQRNRAGKFVTTIQTSNGPLNVTMLGWLEGETYSRDLENEDTASQIGEIAGKIHQHASRWRLPAGFTRPKRDAAYFQAMLGQLSVAVDDGRIDYTDFKTLQTATATLKEMLTARRFTRQEHGLLHGDLHRGNLLICNGEVRVIDFSFCCLGNYMFDLGICLSNLRQEFHPVFLESYQRFSPLPADFARQIEGFYIGSMLGTLVFMRDNPDLQENLVRRASILAREYAARFNRDERFWFGQ